MRYQPIDPQLFVNNRRRLREVLPKNSYVKLDAGKLKQRTGDTDYPFRVNSDFFWATGLEEPGSTLVISPAEESLFVPVKSAFDRLWTGSGLSIEEARRRSGVEDTRSFDKLRKYKKELLVEPVEAHSLIKPLRMVKQPEEIKLMKTAAAITVQGFKAAMLSTRSGSPEYQLEAELTHQFVLGGGGHAYDPIVAAGQNATTIHYISNDTSIRDGDLILVDAGAEYANYASDVTRTWPASGRFSERQREVYEAVSRVQRTVIGLLKPGIQLIESERRAAEVMTIELIKLGLLPADSDPKACRQFFPHATSHFLGLDVHDVGDYKMPLAPGMVVTVEPGIYIPEENIGIRLEDDILITEKGTENLTKAIPIDVDEIENLLASRS